MARHGGERWVQGKIPRRTVERMPADIEIRHRPGATPRGIEGEAAGEAENVEDIPPLGQRLDAGAIVALIQEKTGLLPMQHRRFEADPVF